MPIHLAVKRKLLSRSDRVKSVDLHPTEPWILSSLYNGQVQITNYVTQAVVRTFEVSDLPVRSAKFVARKQWIICGSDDMTVKVYNYNTLEKEKVFEAHQDYIRCIAVHPTLPYVLTTSDDMSIKLWDWENNWQNKMIFEGHTHYVMMAVFNPKDPNIFATASLDRTVKVWRLNSSTPNFSLEGHDKGVNCVDFYPGGDKPYVISGSDDRTAKVWDYQTKSCVQTLEGHTDNVSVAAFHPDIPLIVTGSEDGSIQLWNSSTYRLEDALNYDLERVWSITVAKDMKLGVGYDCGTVVLKLGKGEPVASMDQNGKIIWAVNNEIQQLNVNTLGGETIQDGEKLVVPSKDLGTCEMYPTYMKHDAKGRFVVVIGNGEYIIYAPISWRNKTFGNAEELVWGIESGQYAVRESSGKIKVFQNFKEHKTFTPTFGAEQLFGGPLFAIRSKDKGKEFVSFYDWETCTLVRSIGVAPKNIFWSENGENVVLACDTSYYVLRYDTDLVRGALASEGALPADGIAKAFELEHEIGEKVKQGQWVADCFIYTSSAHRLNYFIGGEVVTLAHLDKACYFLGFVAKHSRVFLVDKERNLISYQLQLSVLEYETAIVRKEYEAAESILTRVPKEQFNQLARFLDGQGEKELALRVSTDPEHKFELALELGNLDEAFAIAKTSDSESKWKQLGDIALAKGDLQRAEESLHLGKDYNGLLLLYTSTGNAAGIRALAQASRDNGKNNVAFMCFFLLHDVEAALDILIDTERLPEAAFFARTYIPSQISRVLKLWKEDLGRTNAKAAESLADPIEFPNMFQDINFALQGERKSRSAYVEAATVEERDNLLPPAEAYPQYKSAFHRNIVEEMKAELEQDGDVSNELTAELDAIPTTSGSPKAASVAAAAVLSPTSEAAAIPAPLSPAAPSASATATTEAPVKGKKGKGGGKAD